ncbi:DUF1460 domain-containing protein [bacterium]|nr:DUF1460 domain-containing protein [bacterium]
MFKRLVFSFFMAGCVFNAPRAYNIGDEYLGAKYILDPLGEASGYDPDPLIRFDAFDCTTFVETVLAGGDENKLTKIRYADGRVDWRMRNHFIETDWLQNNATLVQNVSSEYGTTSMRFVRIDKRAWARVSHGMDIDTAPADVSIEYIAYENIDSIKNKDPLIVLFIVAPRDDKKMATDIAVVHMGFLLPGGHVLRHASTGRGVVDDSFTQYLEMRKKMKNNIGISLVKIK